MKFPKTPIMLVASLAALNVAMTARADVLECSFTTECLDTEGCADTAYDLTVEFIPGDPGVSEPATKSDGAGDTLGSLAMKNGVVNFTGGDAFEGQHDALTVIPGGDARLVVTLVEVPMIITYAGSCLTTE